MKINYKGFEAALKKGSEYGTIERRALYDIIEAYEAAKPEQPLSNETRVTPKPDKHDPRARVMAEGVEEGGAERPDVVRPAALTEQPVQESEVERVAVAVLNSRRRLLELPEVKSLAEIEMEFTRETWRGITKAAIAALPVREISNDEAGWYVNEAGKKIPLCSAGDAIMFGLEYYSEDVFAFYEFMLEWSHGTIEEVQAEFDAWKNKNKTTSVEDGEPK